MTKLNWRRWQFICLQESVIKKREVSFIAYRWWKWYRRQSIFFLFFVWGKRNGNALLSAFPEFWNPGKEVVTLFVALHISLDYISLTAYCRTRTSTETRTGTVGNNRSWFLSLSRTSVNISTWYFTFHLFPVAVLVPFRCSVNKPLVCSTWSE